MEFYVIHVVSNVCLSQKLKEKNIDFFFTFKLLRNNRQLLASRCVTSNIVTSI